MNNFMIIGYGKYKGCPIESIPSDYLEKLIETTENENLIKAIEDEIEFREIEEEIFKTTTEYENLKKATLMYMKYGKYKNWAVIDIPTDYLEWLLENTYSKKLIKVINEELEFRETIENFGKIK